MPEEMSDPADLLPAASAFQVSQVGDLSRLGKHHVLCGNALSRDSYEVLMYDQKAHMIFTDPPYNVPITGRASGKGRRTHREFIMASGEMSEDEFTRFLQNAFTNLPRFGRNPSLQYICMDWRHLSEALGAGRSVYSAPKNLCVWMKDNAGLGSFYRRPKKVAVLLGRPIPEQDPEENS